MALRRPSSIPPRHARDTLLVRYLAADVLSLLGNAVALIVLPLLVLSRTGSASATGIVMVAMTVPAVVAGLMGGALVDRLDRRRVSVAADLVSAASIAALPTIDALWGLGLGWFILMGTVGAFGDLPGLAAREALAPAVADCSGRTLERLVGLREGLGAIVMLAGPAAAGLLIWLLPMTTVLWFTATTSAAAALVTATLGADVGEYERADRGQMSITGAGRQALQGFRVIAADGMLGALVGLTTVAASVIGVLQVLVLPVHFATTGRPELLGTVLTGLAAGLLAGGATYAALAERFSADAWLRLGVLAGVAGLVVVAALPPFPLLMGGAVLAGAGLAPANAVAASTIVHRIHEGLHGRVIAAQNTLAMTVLPLVLLPAALLVEGASPRAVGLGLGGLLVVATVALLASPAARGPARPQSGAAG